MNLLTDTWKGLVQRKLWPVALLLVAALVAVPMLLAKTPEVAPAAANAGQTTKADDISASYVSEATADDDDTTGTAKRRRTLGQSKDPFEPAPLPKAKKSKKAKAAQATPTPTATPDAAASGPSSGSGGVAPVATPTPTPTPTYPLYAIKVQFGKVDGDLKTVTVPRLKVLPSVDEPLLVYRGVEDGGKVAVFELTGTVVAMGDGKCEPKPSDCQVLKLKAGDTEFLTVSDTGDEATDAQYQLTLSKIHAGTTSTKAALAKASSAGRDFLGALASDQSSRYVFDEATGTLHKLDAKSASELTKAALRKSL